MKCPKCGHKFKDPARVTGGKVSKRTITPEQQLALQEARKAKRLSKPENKALSDSHEN
jgi:hypothetical protein